MNPTEEKIIRCMKYSKGTNWTPKAISERIDADREYVKSLMYTLEKHNALERVSRGLYRIPAD